MDEVEQDEKALKPIVNEIAKRKLGFVFIKDGQSTIMDLPTDELNLPLGIIYDDYRNLKANNYQAFTETFTMIMLARTNNGETNEYYIPTYYLMSPDFETIGKGIKGQLNRTVMRLKMSVVLPGDVIELLTDDQFKERMQLRYGASLRKDVVRK